MRPITETERQMLLANRRAELLATVQHLAGGIALVPGLTQPKFLTPELVDQWIDVAELILDRVEMRIAIRGAEQEANQ